MIGDAVLELDTGMESSFSFPRFAEAVLRIRLNSNTSLNLLFFLLLLNFVSCDDLFVLTRANNNKKRNVYIESI